MVQIMRETNHGTIHMFKVNGVEVDIIETDLMFDAWVRTAPINKWGAGGGGIATFLIGTFKKQDNGMDTTYDEFLEFVAYELKGIDYIKEELEKLDNID
jgi:hypothetical protein